MGKEVQITSGGTNLYVNTQTLYIGDATTDKKTMHLMKSHMVGADTGMECVNTFTGGGSCTDAGAVDGQCTPHNAAGADCIAQDITGGGSKCTYTAGCGTYTAAVAAAKIHHVPNTNADNDDEMTPGMRYSLECDTTKLVTKMTVTAGGNSAHDSPAD